LLLSVIIPTRNRAALLSRLLDSLMNQVRGRFEWEILIVDNASTDQTPQVARQYQKSSPIPIRYLQEPRLGLVYGRHCGIAESNGEILGFLDDDMHLAPTWVLGHEHIAFGHSEAVVGRILPDIEGPIPLWLQKYLRGGTLPYLGLLDLGTVKKIVRPTYVFGGNCFLPKPLIYSLGGFHPDGVPKGASRYRGDGETGLMIKFENSGFRSLYDPRATAYHIIGADRLTIEYFCARAFNQGISDSYTHIRNDLSIRYWRSSLTRVRLICSALIGDSVQAMVRSSYWAGYRYHQTEVQADPDLYQWVKKDTYF
jgi:glucosyl-dolichyl phosphate glucuronosyltransferase